jgi:hypothetical protein
VSEATAMNLAHTIVGNISVGFSVSGISYEAGIAFPKEYYEKLERLIEAWYDTRIYDEVKGDENVSEPDQQFKTIVSLLKEAREFVEIYKSRNPKWLSGESIQDPSGAHGLSESIREALASLDK